jgi:hypothetical protein
MSDPLATYLEDHLAGAVFAIDLLEALRDEHAHDPLGQFAAEMLVEIEADRALLQGLAERAGGGSSTLKEVGAWLSEKMTRLKLRRRTAGPLGTFESLEALALGILGKLALWRALATNSPYESRLHGIDFDYLSLRAQTQHARVEEWRLTTARTALSPTPVSR